jgi:acetylornithine deacetylase/succinyl-diaminopimelate desuccinylase-like protein
MTPTTRAYYARTGAAVGGMTGRAMVALANNPGDKGAEATVSADRTYNSMLRTTCVATLLDGGHANNALPQRAGANVNCRIYPGETIEETLATLRRVVFDANVKITVVPPIRPLAKAPPLDPKIMGPAEKLTAKYFPGVPLVPKMFAAATDGIFVSAAGIPVYGVPGGWLDPDNNGTHGLNERRSVRSVYVGRDFLTELVKVYAEQES